MSVLFSVIAERRSDALRKWFHTREMPPVIAIIERRSLKEHPTEGGGDFEKLGRRRERNVYVWKKGDPESSSLWVLSSYSSYRSAYKAFIRSLYGQVDFTDFDQFHVDHLFAKGQRRAHAKYVRVEAVPKGTNMQHGFTVESDQAKQKTRKRRSHDHMSFLSVLKLMGLRAPRGPDDHAQIKKISRALEKDGWDRKEVEQALLTLTALYKRR